MGAIPPEFPGKPGKTLPRNWLRRSGFLRVEPHRVHQRRTSEEKEGLGVAEVDAVGIGNRKLGMRTTVLGFSNSRSSLNFSGERMNLMDYWPGLHFRIRNALPICFSSGHMGPSLHTFFSLVLLPPISLLSVRRSPRTSPDDPARHQRSEAASTP